MSRSEAGTFQFTGAYTNVRGSVGSIQPNGKARRLIVEASIDGTSGTVTGFDVQLQAHPNAAPFVFLQDTDFQSGSNTNLRFCTTIGPNQLAASQASNFIIDIPAAHIVIFRAVSATSGNMTIRGRSQDF